MTSEWLNAVAPHALAYPETLEATYDIACSALARGIPGDFVECGVYQGAQCAVMARAIMDFAQSQTYSTESFTPAVRQFEALQRRVHLFDSFQGMPAAQPHDEEIWSHHGPKTGDVAVALATVKENMRRWGIPDNLLRYHEGWFENTVDQKRFVLIGEPKQIAVLRLDADLYSSTKVCMEHLYPLVSRGGWVIVDDWNLTGCRKAVDETVIPAPVYWRIPTK